MLFNLELFKIYTQYIRENSNYAQIQKENKFFIKTVEETKAVERSKHINYQLFRNYT